MTIKVEKFCVRAMISGGICSPDTHMIHESERRRRESQPPAKDDRLCARLSLEA